MGGLEIDWNEGCNGCRNKLRCRFRLLSFSSVLLSLYILQYQDSGYSRAAQAFAAHARAAAHFPLPRQKQYLQSKAMPVPHVADAPSLSRDVVFHVVQQLHACPMGLPSPPMAPVFVVRVHIVIAIAIPVYCRV